MPAQFVCRLEDRCLIKVSGADAESFLQNLVTNDVTKTPMYSCLLAPQGRFLHDFFISRAEDGFFLECETARRDDLIRRLNVFKMRSKVNIEDCTGLFDVYASAQQPKDIPAFQDPRHKGLGFRFYLPKNTQIKTDPPETYRDRRISFGVPEGSGDIKPDADLPADVNLDRLNAISWDKGCYVGQEVTARMNNRNLVKKRMVVVSGQNLSAGSILSQGGADVGEVRSVNSLKTEGLAILKLAALENAVTLAGGAAVSARLPENT